MLEIFRILCAGNFLDSICLKFFRFYMLELFWILYAGDFSDSICWKFWGVSECENKNRFNTMVKGNGPGALVKHHGSTRLPKDVDVANISEQSGVIWKTEQGNDDA